MNCFVKMPRGKPHQLVVVGANGKEHDILDLLVNSKDIMLKIEIMDCAFVGTNSPPKNKLKIDTKRLKSALNELFKLEEKCTAKKGLCF